jgi:TolB-like protein/Tfp pilus assembly protein PilF
MQFLHRLRQRKLVQWTLAYLAGAWLTYEAATLLGQAFAWPHLILRPLVVVLGVGLIATLVLAWYHGERGRQHVSVIELALLAGLVVIAGAGAAAVGFTDPRANATRAEARYDAPLPRIPEHASLAVLPCLDFSADRSWEYFADGLTENVINGLGRLHGLRVAGRTSSFAFKDRNSDVREVGDRLNVAHVLECSVQREADSIRVSVRLVDAREGHQLWSARYDRQHAGLFSVQDEIVAHIVDELRVHMPENDRQTATIGTRSFEAHDQYLRGLYHLNRREIRQALDLFSRAVELDPEYAAPQAGIALAESLSPLHLGTPPARAMARAKAAALRAAALDPALAEAYLALGLIAESFEYDWEASNRAYRRALDLRPNLATAHQWYGSSLAKQGDADNALWHARRAVELEPLSGVVNAGYFMVLRLTRDLDRAAAHLETIRELFPEPPEAGPFTYWRFWRIMIHADRRRYDLARAEVESTFAELRNFDPKPFLTYLAGIEDPTRAALALEVARRWEGLARPSSSGGLGVLQREDLMAGIYARLGAADPAVSVLQTAWERRSGGLPWVSRDPAFDAVQGDPRFRDLMRRIGLDSAPVANMR